MRKKVTCYIINSGLVENIALKLTMYHKFQHALEPATAN